MTTPAGTALQAAVDAANAQFATDATTLAQAQGVATAAQAALTDAQHQLAAAQTALQAAVAAEAQQQAAQVLANQQATAAINWIIAEHPGDTVSRLLKDPYILVQSQVIVPQTTTLQLAPSLQTCAAAAGMKFGTQVFAQQINVPGYSRFFQEIANGGIGSASSVDEAHFQPSQGTFSYSNTDPLLTTLPQFGATAKFGVIGGDNPIASPSPSWYAGAITSPATATSVMQALITGTIGHYAGKVPYWNIVNEALKPFGDPGLYRPNPFLTQLGTDFNTGYIATAIKMARAADPATKLILNFNHCETTLAGDLSNQTAILGLLSGLQAAGNSPDLVGLEFHVNASQLASFSGPSLVTFANGILTRGCGWCISEFDVNDDTNEGPAHAVPGPEIPASYPARDAIAAQWVNAVGAALALPTLIALPHHWTWWGLRNDLSWLQQSIFSTPRTDGQQKRPDILDASGTVTAPYLAQRQVFAALSGGLSPSVAAVTGFGVPQLFQAIAVDQNGVIKQPQPVMQFQSNNTGIAVIGDTTGEATSVGVGTALISVTGGGLTGAPANSMIVSNSVTPPPVPTTVSVLPATPTISVGGQQPFTGQVKDASGNIMTTGFSSAWLSAAPGIASVNAASGLATGVAAGSTVITDTVTSAGHPTISGATGIVVAAKATGSRANLPAGMAPQIDTGALTANPPQTFNGSLKISSVGGGYTVQNFSPNSIDSSGQLAANLSKDPTRSGWRINYLPSLIGGASPVRFGGGVSPSGTVGDRYMQWLFWTSSNLAGPTPGGVKLLFPRTPSSTGASGTNHAMYAWPASGSSSVLSPSIQLQYSGGAGSRNLPVNQGHPGIMNDGAQHNIEYYFGHQSAPGAGNGTYLCWLDGVLVASYSDVNWVPSGGVGWVYDMFDPTWGGGLPSQHPSSPMFWAFDTLFVATR